MPRLSRDGVHLLRNHGEGPVILLSHGYSATSEMWRGQIEALSRRHQLIIWDMRGHGRSDYPQESFRVQRRGHRRRHGGATGRGRR